MEGAIPFAIIVWICALVFIAIGIYSLKRKTPMHFWSGTTVKVEEISDIKAYNKANGIMWISYGFTYIIGGILSLLFNTNVGGIIVAILGTLGIIILVLVYQRIYQKYKK